MAAIFLCPALSLSWTPARESGFELTGSGLPNVILMVPAAPLLIDELGFLRQFLFAFLLRGTLTTALIIAKPAFTV